MRLRIRVKVYVFRRLEKLLSRMCIWSQAMVWKVSVCGDCGRNRYTGYPCKGVNSERDCTR